MNIRSLEGTRNPRHRDPNVQPGRSILRPKSVGSSRSEENVASTSNHHHKPSRPRISATAIASGTPKEQRPPNTQSVSIELPSNIRQINSGSPGSGPLFQIQLPPDADVEDLERLVAGLASKSLGKKPSRGKGVPRPLGKREDDPEILTHRMDEWAAGDYGPVLDPFTVFFKRIPLVINPCLRPPSPDKGSQELHWTMIYPKPKALQSSSDGPSPTARQPATLPRVSSVNVMSRSFPWTIHIPAKNLAIGVTCADVVKELYDSFNLPLKSSVTTYFPPETVDRMKKAGFARHALVPDEFHAMRRIDWLLEETVFGGLVEDPTEDPDNVKEGYSFLPATMVLFCRRPDGTPASVADPPLHDDPGVT